MHPPILERAQELLGLDAPVAHALDVGCGAGGSTRALTPVARVRTGIDPAAAMVRAAAAADDDAGFVRATGERLPFRDRSCQLVTAAGSLSFSDLPATLAEVARVLTSDGALVAYDFGPGRADRGVEGLADWWAEFLGRWPRTPTASVVTPETLAAGPLRLAVHEAFTISLRLDLDRFLAYVMTESNVTRAVRAGTPLDVIASWCAETLAPRFAGPRPVPFDCWLAGLVRRAPSGR